MKSKNLIVTAGLLIGCVIPAAHAQSFTNLHNFTGGNDGAYPDSGLILSGKTLYGTAYGGGNSSNGTVFAVNTNGTSFAALYSFSALDAATQTTNSDGTGPNAVLLSGNTLYGTAEYGGSSGNGTVFSINTNGTGLATLYSFSALDTNTDTINSDGANPYAGLILSGNTLYGTAQYGGSAGNGTVFKVNTNGTGFAVLYTFSALDAATGTINSDGASPFAGLLLSGNTLYGTAAFGGSGGDGTVFSLNTNGTGFMTLYSFSATDPNGLNNDGANPFAGLVLSGNTLYGTAAYGGNWGSGTVFSLNTNGTGFAALYSFSETDANGFNKDGAGPGAGLILSSNTLFGTAAGGGSAGNGTAFAVNTNGTGFTTLYSFSATNASGFNGDGATPIAGLILSRNTLFGTALNGGSAGDGTVFSLSLAAGPSAATVAFTANPTNGVVPLTVSFNSAAVDSAGKTITNWNWNFGDGSTSTTQSPSHTYTNSGTFSLSLFATNSIGGRVIGSGPASIRANPAPVNSGLVLNGGFETGNLSGWTLSGSDTNDIIVDSGFASRISPHSGDYLAALGPVGSVSYLSQTLATTSGAAYLLSFWLNSPDGLTPNEFLVSWGGGTLFDEVNRPAITGWTNFQFAVVATGSSTVLQFGARDDNSYFGLDDISVLQTGSLAVTISPPAVVTAGALWVLDGTNRQNSGATLTNLAVGDHTVSFTPISDWEAPSNQIVVISNGLTSTANGNYILLEKGSPKLTLTAPKSAQSVSNSVLVVTGTVSDKVAVLSVNYHLNGGGWMTATTTTNHFTNWTASVPLYPGASNLSAYALDFSGAFSTTNMVAFKYIPSATLTIHPNGNGTVAPNDNGALLAIGTNYTLTASPGKNWIFSNWVASGSESFISNNPVLKFAMQSNLMLQANFVTNVFLAAQGTYNGLFAPTNAPRQQTNSGAITFTVSSTGVLSGKLTIGTNTPSLSGQFNPAGTVTITTPRKGLSTLTTFLQLNFADQSVDGTVGDNSFLAPLAGDQAFFNSTRQATNYEGQYTLIIRGTNEATVGPFGTSYGTVTVSASGGITFAGSLADGTSVSQSSVVSQDGLWPFYLPLYGSNGSFWSWNYFGNGAIVSATNGSWINATNTSKTALYRAGFTNQTAVIVGSKYNPNTVPLLALTNGQVILEGGDLLPAITNLFTLSSKNAIILTNASDTNKLVLTITKSTGVITGSFTNPATKKSITVNGVILQNQANAQGYFLGTNASGTITLKATPPAGVAGASEP